MKKIKIRGNGRPSPASLLYPAKKGLLITAIPYIRGWGCSALYFGPRSPVASIGASAREREEGTGYTGTVIIKHIRQLELFAEINPCHNLQPILYNILNTLKKLNIING